MQIHDIQSLNHKIFKLIRCQKLRLVAEKPEGKLNK